MQKLIYKSERQPIYEQWLATLPSALAAAMRDYLPEVADCYRIVGDRDRHYDLIQVAEPFADLPVTCILLNDLHNEILKGARLQGADLSGSNLSGVDLRAANLKEANLSKARLRRINLSGANLDLANLTESNLSQVNLDGASLTGTEAEEAAAEHEREIREVAKAEQGAQVKNSSKVVESLKSTGKWTWDVAEKIGVSLATEAIKQSIGLS